MLVPVIAFIFQD